MLPMLFVTNKLHNKLQQYTFTYACIYFIVLSCGSFCTDHLEFKKQQNDNLIKCVCEAIFALAYYVASWLPLAW